MESKDRYKFGWCNSWCLTVIGRQPSSGTAGSGWSGRGSLHRIGGFRPSARKVRKSVRTPGAFRSTVSVRRMDEFISLRDCPWQPIISMGRTSIMKTLVRLIRKGHSLADTTVVDCRAGPWRPVAAPAVDPPLTAMAAINRH